ncbi:MAG: GNAT family N-acetyltransferase [Burkholderiaceae bacterium]
MNALLDNIFWHALTGPQAGFAAGSGGARRFAKGLSPIVAFEHPDAPDFDALAACCEVDEALYCAGWSGLAPAGWRIDADTTMLQMVWDAPAPEATALPGLRVLAASDVPQMLELARLTHPGPFGPRTIELGEYLGCFDGERLIAMAGERSHAGAWREVSGVCTHPDAQGRGLAGGLMRRVIRRQLAAGETPFLHVMSANANAIGLYRRMGFRDRIETPVRVLARQPTLLFS